jgi:hypothetical protein
VTDWIEDAADRIEDVRKFDSDIGFDRVNKERVARIIREAYQKHQQSQLASAAPDNTRCLKYIPGGLTVRNA